MATTETAPVPQQEIDWSKLGVSAPAIEKGMRRDVYLCDKCETTDSPLVHTSEHGFGPVLNCNRCGTKGSMHQVDPDKIPELIALLEAKRRQ